MHLVNNDGDRVRAKLAAAPEHERGQLIRSSVNQAKPAPPAKLTDNLTAAMLAGFVHGIIVMMSFGSFAIVIFGQSEHVELQNALAIGVSQQVLSAFVLIGLLTFKGFFPFTMGGPTPPAALLSADVVRAVVDNVEDPEKKVPTALVTIAMISILMGVMLMLISWTKTTVYALQLPYPVLCGFLGSVGVLLMRNAIAILLNLKMKWIFIPADMDRAKQLDPVGMVLQLLLGFAVAAILLQGVPRIRAKLSKKAGLTVLPILFILPLVTFYVAILAGGFEFGADSELRTAYPPWLSPAPKWTWAPKDFFTAMYDFTKWDIGAMMSVEAIFRMFISAFLCVIAALINMAGIEVNAPQAKSLDLDAEFMWLGRANLVVGLLGGHPGHHVAAFTLPMKKDGGTTKVAPWTASVIWFFAFISAAPLSTVIPRFFFGGCFLQVGFGLARTFLWDNRKALDRISTLIALITVAAAIMTDLNIASAVAFVLVALNFLRLSMNITVVRAVERADTRRAPCYRRPQEIEVLQLHGHRIMVLYLHGYLFWGTVDEITSAFADIIDGTEDDPEVIYVDMRYVSGIELSVINTFKKLHRLAAGVGIQIKLCSLPGEDIVGPGLCKLLKGLPFASSEDLTDLVEKAENKLLETWMANSPTNCQRQSIATQSADERLKQRVIRSWKKFTALVQEEMKQRRTTKKQNQLRELVTSTYAAYGIWWEHFKGDLVMGQTQLPEWRAAELVEASCKKQTAVRTYVSESPQRFLVSPNFQEPDEKTALMSPDEALDEEKAVKVDTMTPQGPLEVLCTTREPVVGDAVCLLNGLVVRDPNWTLEPGAVAIVLEVDTDGDFKLQNPSGKVSEKFVRRKDFKYVQAPDEEKAVNVDSTDSLPEFTDVHSVPVLGRAFLKQKAMVCHDVVQLPENVYHRKKIAAEFSIKRIIFIPMSDGVIELGAKCVPDNPQHLSSAPVVLPESPAVLASLENTRILCNVFRATEPKEIPRQVNNLSESLSWNLLLSIGTLGRFQKLTKEKPVLEEPDASVGITKKNRRAQHIYLIIDGTFGTFKMSDAGNLVIIMKSPAGTCIGTDDVWAERPRSVQLRCLSDEGQVVALSRDAVKRLELCHSPFVGPRESEEFINFMKREMALKLAITASAFANPDEVTAKSAPEEFTV